VITITFFTWWLRTTAPQSQSNSSAPLPLRVPDRVKSGLTRVVVVGRVNPLTRVLLLLLLLVGSSRLTLSLGYEFRILRLSSSSSSSSSSSGSSVEVVSSSSSDNYILLLLPCSSKTLHRILNPIRVHRLDYEFRVPRPSSSSR